MGEDGRGWTAGGLANATPEGQVFFFAVVGLSSSCSRCTMGCVRHGAARGRGVGGSWGSDAQSRGADTGTGAPLKLARTLHGPPR